MCYGISGTIDDKFRVRCQFTCSHDEMKNKPDENRRTYWEWETHYPFRTFVFTNASEVGKPMPGMKKAVGEFLKANRIKILEALVTVKSRQGTVLFGKAKTGNVGFWGAKTGNVDFSKAKTGNVDFWEAKTGNVDFSEAKTENVNFWEAKTGNVNFSGAKVKKFFIKDLKTGSRKLNKLIKEFSFGRDYDKCTLSNFVKWLLDRRC